MKRWKWGGNAEYVKVEKAGHDRNLGIRDGHMGSADRDVGSAECPTNAEPFRCGSWDVTVS